MKLLSLLFPLQILMYLICSQSLLFSSLLFSASFCSVPSVLFLLLCSFYLSPAIFSFYFSSLTFSPILCLSMTFLHDLPPFLFLLSSSAFIFSFHLLLPSSRFIICFHLLLSSSPFIFFFHLLSSSPFIFSFHLLLSSSPFIFSFHLLLSAKVLIEGRS